MIIKAPRTTTYFLLPTLRKLLGLYTAYVTEYEHDIMGRIAHIVLKFDNGYGASIIPCGVSGKMWEIGVLDSNGNLCYTTPVANDVIPWKDISELHKILADIYRLPKEK